MARRRYLVAYDIRNDRRLRAVATCMESFGERVQYSVFVCDLSGRELAEMSLQLERLMRLMEDSVMIIDLGGVDAGRFRFLGVHDPLPDPGPTIV